MEHLVIYLLIITAVQQILCQAPNQIPVFKVQKQLIPANLVIVWFQVYLFDFFGYSKNVIMFLF